MPGKSEVGRLRKRSVGWLDERVDWWRMSGCNSVRKVGSCGLSSVLTISKASSQLSWSGHFWSSSSILASVEALADLQSNTGLSIT